MTYPAKTLNFFEISIDNKYVIRIYKSGIYESELGNLSAKMPIEEWNEHAKNIKEIFNPAKKIACMLRQQQAEIEALKEKLKIAEQLERTIDIANYLKKASEK